MRLPVCMSRPVWLFVHHVNRQEVLLHLRHCFDEMFVKAMQGAKSLKYFIARYKGK